MNRFFSIFWHSKIRYWIFIFMGYQLTVHGFEPSFEYDVNIPIDTVFSKTPTIYGVFTYRALYPLIYSKKNALLFCAEGDVLRPILNWSGVDITQYIYETTHEDRSYFGVAYRRSGPGGSYFHIGATLFAWNYTTCGFAVSPRVCTKNWAVEGVFNKHITTDEVFVSLKGRVKLNFLGRWFLQNHRFFIPTLRVSSKFYGLWKQCLFEQDFYLIGGQIPTVGHWKMELGLMKSFSEGSRGPYFGISWKKMM